jgi:peptidoglycan/LPS O-acetylase OafA/YrhL
MANVSTIGGEDAPLPLLPETTAYWSREPYAWSTSLQDYAPPMLTSSHCSKAIYKLFRNTYFSNVGDLDPYQPNFLLSVVTESSSHPAGLDALYAQPWMYAGPGLGNVDECPLQTCIAGGRKADSITFASVCMMPECSAYDLAADDFVSTVARQLDFAVNAGITPSETIDLGHEYVNLLRRIADVNKFLKTGWTCGAFLVPFDLFPFGLPYVVCCSLLVTLACIGTTCRRRKPQHEQHPKATSPSWLIQPSSDGSSPTAMLSLEETSALLSENGSMKTYHAASINKEIERNGSCRAYDVIVPLSRASRGHPEMSNLNRFWSAFDVSHHLKRLVSPDHPETACLDGLRVGSTFWIMLGHVMAIQSSSGAGYSNPANFLPPTGLTTTLAGQLLFSSRLAVDTFLVISGFLVVHVLEKKLRPTGPKSPSFCANVVWRYVTNIPLLLLGRVLRTLPMYAMSLGFYTQIAPQLGSGPFWYQWIGLLKPCHDAVWTNFLFVNNFIPFDTPTTSTCFYHSWYLAVDMQLFLVAPLLIFWYQYHPQHGMFVTAILFVTSALGTVYLTHSRSWSVNTFDGIQVARYDMEAYAKPHIRAQAYLLGMYVAMLLSRRSKGSSRSHERSAYTWKHRFTMLLALLAMATVAFITVTGAYARRPCTYDENPLQDECGSLWTPIVTFMYTSSSRTVWSIGTAVVIYLSVGRGCWESGGGNMVSSILSWSCWTPLSHLSFGAYLIHPIVIFIWQLGGREKQIFCLLTFGMDFLSVAVVSYVASLIAVLLVEFPCVVLWKHCLASWRVQ